MSEQDPSTNPDRQQIPLHPEAEALFSEFIDFVKVDDANKDVTFREYVKMIGKQAARSCNLAHSEYLGQDDVDYQRWLENPSSSKPSREPRSDNDDITTSFARPIMPEEPQPILDRIGMMFDDVRDNEDWIRPPYTAKYEGPESAKLLERLLSDGATKSVRRLGQHYENGHMYRRITHVGDKDKGTYHPHYYFMDRTHPGMTRMYFVDPEHKVANNNIWRPPIVNLVGIEVPDRESTSSRVTIMRCRVPKYDFKHKPEGLGPDELFTVIEQALERNGGLPDEFTGDMESKVLFMIASDHNSSRVQARYSTKKQIEGFARGERGSSALEGKVWVHAYVVNRLINLFNQRAEARKVV
ncbi:hypothetical protein KDA00_03930 [Candidatus Saccharibacteria bacterium]|nr:hypothetical protein [Candidatus Saccharibacteria bacterium]